MIGSQPPKGKDDLQVVLDTFAPCITAKKAGRINIPFDKDTRINPPFSFNSVNNVELITLVLLELIAKIN